VNWVVYAFLVYKKHWGSLEKARKTRPDSLVKLQRFSQDVPHLGLLSIISIPFTTPILSVLKFC
jgi:hypothetical protein